MWQGVQQSPGCQGIFWAQCAKLGCFGKPTAWKRGSFEDALWSWDCSSADLIHLSLTIGMQLSEAIILFGYEIYNGVRSR